MKMLEQTVSSREVAEMMEIEHYNLLQKIDSINEDLAIENSVAKYWTEGTFKNRGKEYREFQVTKRGCEFLAHKTTGTRGNLFTDRYMDKFESMKEQLSAPTSYLEALLECARIEKERLELEDKVKRQQPLVAVAEERIEKKGCFSITDATKSLGLKRGQITRWAKDKGYIHKSITEVNEAGKEFFKVYSSDGVHNQIGINRVGMELINANLEDIKAV